MGCRLFVLPDIRLVTWGLLLWGDLICLGLLRMMTRLHSLYHVQKQHMINIRRSPNVQAHSFRLHSLHRE